MVKLKDCRKDFLGTLILEYIHLVCFNIFSEVKIWYEFRVTEGLYWINTNPNCIRPKASVVEWVTALIKTTLSILMIEIALIMQLIYILVVKKSLEGKSKRKRENVDLI